MIVPRNELRKRAEKRVAVENKVDQRIGAGPDEEHDGNAQHIFFQNGIHISVPPQKQRTADHHKDGNRPLAQAAVQIESKPCS